MGKKAIKVKTSLFTIVHCVIVTFWGSHTWLKCSGLQHMCSPREDAIVHVKTKKICLIYTEKAQSYQAYLFHADGTDRETQCPSELGIFLLQVDKILLFLEKKSWFRSTKNYFQLRVQKRNQKTL